MINHGESNALIPEVTTQPEGREESGTANRGQQEQRPTEQRQDQSVIMLFDFLEREPAPAADPVPVLLRVIPEEMVEIPDLEEI